jgi:hypothetical protein
MTGAARDPGISANFRYTTSTDLTLRGHHDFQSYTLVGAEARNPWRGSGSGEPAVAIASGSSEFAVFVDVSGNHRHARPSHERQP